MFFTVIFANLKKIYIFKVQLWFFENENFGTRPNFLIYSNRTHKNISNRQRSASFLKPQKVLQYIAPPYCEGLGSFFAGGPESFLWPWRGDLFFWRGSYQIVSCICYCSCETRFIGQKMSAVFLSSWENVVSVAKGWEWFNKGKHSGTRFTSNSCYISVIETIQW